MEHLESEHKSRDLLDKKLVLLDYNINLFGLNDTYKLTISCEFWDDF